MLLGFYTSKRSIGFLSVFFIFVFTGNGFMRHLDSKAKMMKIVMLNRCLLREKIFLLIIRCVH